MVMGSDIEEALESECDEALKEVERLEAELTNVGEKMQCMKSLIEDLHDSSPCYIDHNGGCQAHYWFGDTECPHGRAQKLLREK